MPPISLNLKQKLASLSQSTTSSSPFGNESPSSPATMKKKFNFNPPWVKRQQNPTGPGDYREEGTLQEVMSRMIFQAGVDFETRPMVVLNASALPDPQDVSYDLLLSRILSYLNLYVESDYTVVFFAAGGKYTPGWNWVWKAYRSLSRKYRKNLKQLYIVHSSFFTKSVSFAGAPLRSRIEILHSAFFTGWRDHQFFRKLVYLSTLSELAHCVPITQIDIPPAVYQENSKYESKITLPNLSRSNVFGVPLEDLMGFHGEKGSIPRVVKDSLQFLRGTGLEDEGLFRRSPSSATLKAAQEAYDRGHVVSLDTFGDPHLAAVLLKKYLRDLPEPIFPEHLYPMIRRCPPPNDDTTDMSSITYIRDSILPELVPCAYILLSHVMQLMHEVSLRAASNRMDAHNLALVISPNLVKSPNIARDIEICGVPGGPSLFQSNAPLPDPASMRGRTTLGMVVKHCIQHYYEIFDEVWDRSEAVVPRGAMQSEGAVSLESSSVFAPPTHVIQDEDDEDIDDAMLVMPIGPTYLSNGSQAKNGPSQNAWAGGQGIAQRSGLTSNQNFSPSSFSTNARSMHTVAQHGTNGNFSYPVYGKAKSTVSIENSSERRKGSISVGRGTMKKASGAGVEALSITAEGFFSPHPVPPLPPLHKSNGRRRNGGVL